MRRFLIVSALWLGLLGSAEPLLACAMNLAGPNCCASGTQTPCVHGSGQMGADVRAHCCAAAPVGEPVTVSASKFEARLRAAVSGSADVSIIASRAIDPPAATGRLLSPPRSTDSVASFGARTYLRTGRLRL